jgi:hypothetical protein
MPTQVLCQLVVEGAPAKIASFRKDDAVWNVEPWRFLYGARLDDESSDRRLVYRYSEDFKRPAPSVTNMAARFPDLRFILEACDEFAESAVRLRYANGVLEERRKMSPYVLSWLEWEEADDADG